MTKEEIVKAVEKLTEEEQLEIMREIICRFWPELDGKPVGFYDASKAWEDWDDKELDEYYNRKWEEIQTRGHRTGEN